MRIARFAAAGADPAYGIVELAADGGEHPDTVAAISGDPLAGPVSFTGMRHRLDEVRLLAPVIPRSKIVAVARNYAEHAAELGDEVDERPLLFLKPNTSVIGPDEPIVKPVETHELHHEGELAVVIGRICRKVPVERVDEVVLGFTCAPRASGPGPGASTPSARSARGSPPTSTWTAPGASASARASTASCARTAAPPT